MNNKYISAALLIFVVFASIPSVFAVNDQKARGVYVYDEANRIPLESELGLNEYALKVDEKTGYEVVIDFTNTKLDVEQMAKWFNDHGVGKQNKDNGIVLFVFPDNTAYGMIGKGHDRIAVPYMSTFGKRSLSNLKEEPVLAILSFLNIMNKKLDEPTITERSVSFGKTVSMNLDLLALLIVIIYLFVLLSQQGDGFQMSDLILPTIICVLLLSAVGIMSISSDFVESSTIEYGIITSTHIDSYTFPETHCVPSGKTTRCWTDWHTIYTNDVTIKSYDFREFTHKFSSRDSKWSWGIKPDDKTTLTIAPDGGMWGVELGIDDNSGGQTERYGTWIQTN